MSEFSDLLSSYIDEKKIKVYALLEYCNLDRSTMYKIINGKRNPSSEAVFQKITEFLHLTPVEYRRFKEAYLISKLGKDLYYRRKYTEKWFFPHLVEIDVLKLYNTFKIYLPRGIFIWTNLLSYLTQPMN